MRGSMVASDQRTLSEQAEGRLDVTTSNNRGTLLFWLQSRPFTLARVLEGFQDRSYELIKGSFPPPDFRSKRKEDWTSVPAITEELCCFGYNRDLKAFTLAARVLEGARDHSYEWIKGGNVPVDTMEASGRTIGRH